jgi:nitrite reductase (NO-forming)
MAATPIRERAQNADIAATATMGALLGALGIATAAALVVGLVGLNGGIQSVTVVAPSAAPAMTHVTTVAPAVAQPAGKVTLAPAKPATVPNVARAATDVPAPITRTTPAVVKVELETKEVIAEIEKGQTFAYWTFNGTVPGPMLRVRVGDTVELHLKNDIKSFMPHSIDLHAATGPGGGAVATQTHPGKDTVVTFKALNPGLYVYHCATAPIPMHVANGMYGMILVEPEGGLPAVDREFYIVQGELYTNAARGTTGHHEFDPVSMDAENPSFVVINGKAGALTGDNAMQAKVGETARIYYGVGGFMASSAHLIGEIFNKVYAEASLTGPVLTDVQTTLIPAGGAAVMEVKFEVPGSYILLDHTLTRALNKGAIAQIIVTGDHDKSIYDGPLSGAGH